MRRFPPILVDNVDPVVASDTGHVAETAVHGHVVGRAGAAVIGHEGQVHLVPGSRFGNGQTTVPEGQGLNFGSVPLTRRH